MTNANWVAVYRSIGSLAIVGLSSSLLVGCAAPAPKIGPAAVEAWYTSPKDPIMLASNANANDRRHVFTCRAAPNWRFILNSANVTSRYPDVPNGPPVERNTENEGFPIPAGNYAGIILPNSNEQKIEILVETHKSKPYTHAKIYALPIVKMRSTNPAETVPVDPSSLAACSPNPGSE